jgi:hypothetical protein
MCTEFLDADSSGSKCHGTGMCADAASCRACRLTLAVPLVVVLAHKILGNEDE